MTQEQSSEKKSQNETQKKNNTEPTNASAPRSDTKPQSNPKRSQGLSKIDDKKQQKGIMLHSNSISHLMIT